MIAQPERFLRVKQVLELVPVSRTTWLTWVKNGKAPAPIKLSPGTTVWRLSDVQKFAGGECHD